MKYVIGYNDSVRDKEGFLSAVAKVRETQKRPDGIFGSYMTRPFSPFLTVSAYRLGISANAISVLSFVFCIVGALMLFLSPTKYGMIVAAALWWIGAIFDAADGDLARYSNTQSSFGGWLDSFFDRIKEFVIFLVFAIVAFKFYGQYWWFIVGSVAGFANMMSGYISDTRKLMDNGKRKPQVSFNKKYMLGMVDTRDFFIIGSLFLFDVRIALVAYSTLFIAVLAAQFVMIVKRYGLPGSGNEDKGTD